MIKIENVETVGWKSAIRGMRNPKNSWGLSDSGECRAGDTGIDCKSCSSKPCGHSIDHSFNLGNNDIKLMSQLAAAGPTHRKYLRMIVVYMDVTAPLYWWKEFDTYKVGTVANSCSTMHKIHDKVFTIDDFSHEHLEKASMNLMNDMVKALNVCRDMFLESDKKDKEMWYQMIQLLPTSYNQKRTVMLNYEVLANIYANRRKHKLDEWRDFCKWIETLPNKKLILTSAEIFDGSRRIEV